MPNIRRLPFVSALALASGLAACGGGGGGSAPAPPPTGSVPPPAPAPTPTPSPAPTPTPSPPPITGAIGLTQVRDFATFGFGRRFTSSSGGSLIEGTTEPEQGTQVEFRFLAEENGYEVRLPGLPVGRLRPVGPLGDDFTHHSVVDRATGEMLGSLEMFRPAPLNPKFPLSHTSFASWKASRIDPANASRILQNYGDFAYGVPASAAEVPRSGTVTYRLLIYGDVGFVVGSGSLTFDFARGAITGQMDATLNDGIGGLGSIGILHAVDTSYAVDTSGFAGRLARGGSVLVSAFEGRLTGPGGTELMGRWTARVPDPHNPGTMVTLAGLWLGRRE